MAVAELPEELITNILVRLPVKSLGRFRCVCKPWRSFINDPSFIRKHVDRVSTGNECESTAILLICTDAFVCPETPSIESTEIIVEEGQGGGSNHQDGRISNPTVELLIQTIDLPEEFRRSFNLRIKSSCDGILCMASSDFLLLWNPSIKEYKTFPLSGERVRNYSDVYGIGYDCYLDDYKVLRVPSSGFGRSISDSLVEILTLKSMSWKTIQNNFRYDIVYYSQSMLVNGALHWVATNIDTGEKVILYFDVMKEKFGELSLPPGKNNKFPRRNTSYLRQFGGNLCFMVQFFQGRGCLDIWVMKKYGVQESWTKLLTFQPLEGPGRTAEPIHPYCSTPNGILLFNELRGEFVLYNTRDKTFTTLCDNGCIKPFTRNIAYVKSLVSPIK